MTDYLDSQDSDYQNNGEHQALLPNIEEKPKSVLDKFIESKNICENLLKEELQEISSKVLSEFMDDDTSMKKWIMDVDEALKLAKLTKEPKNTPLPQSANIKYPMITTASYQFAARTYPELIQDGKIVKVEIAGQSNPMVDMIAYGVTTHMSHQLLGSDSEWEASMDKLLVVLPNIGFICKKTYWDPLQKKIRSDVCFYKDIVLRNDPSIMCLNDVRRITHILHVHPNDIIEYCREGLYDEDNCEEVMNYYTKNTINPECTLYEQHRYLDLDGDGYEEPYIVTLHKETQKVLRIVARYTKDDIQFNDKKEVVRIAPIQYFTDYHFLPAPDGSFMSVGFGTLMLHLNETVNTILNQLIDAGTLANLQTGFIDSRIKLMGGQMGVNPGDWTRVKGVIGQQLKDGIFPLAYKEPSSVLYQLLGMLLEAAKQLTSSTDAMQGLQNATNVPATSMLAMIEQGMKLYSAIQRRMYRGEKDEFQKIYRLNGIHLDEEDYYAVLGQDYRQLPNIYKTKAIKVIPIADPNLSSDAQRLSQAQIIMSLEGKPGVDNHEVHKRLLEAAKVPNVEKIIPPQMQQTANPPNPKMLDSQTKAKKVQADAAIKMKAHDLKEKEFIAKLSKIEAEITKMQAGSLKDVSQAQALQKGSEIDDFNAKVAAIKTRIDSVAQAHSQMTQHKIASAKVAQDTQKAVDDHNVAMANIKQNQQDLDQTHQREMTGLALQQNQQQHDQEMAENDQQQQPAGQDDSGNDNGMAAPASDQGNVEPSSGDTGEQ